MIQVDHDCDVHCVSILLLPDQGDKDPYWCRLWPSAIALAQLILQQPELVRGKRVCDIGCGLGLAGIAAALAGLPFNFCLSSFPFHTHAAHVAADLLTQNMSPFLHSCNTANTRKMMWRVSCNSGQVGTFLCEGLMLTT